MNLVSLTLVFSQIVMILSVNHRNNDYQSEPHRDNNNENAHSHPNPHGIHHRDRHRENDRRHETQPGHYDHYDHHHHHHHPHNIQHYSENPDHEHKQMTDEHPRVFDAHLHQPDDRPLNVDYASKPKEYYLHPSMKPASPQSVIPTSHVETKESHDTPVQSEEQSSDKVKQSRSDEHKDEDIDRKQIPDKKKDATDKKIIINSILTNIVVIIQIMKSVIQK
ncbi:unnamed protein product [Schistosoma turkestanicum]|nr:unnamed protein product [Schistosoma turkestanicum]